MSNTENTTVSVEDRFLFDLQGFLILRNVLTPEECAEYLEVVNRLDHQTFEDKWMESVGPHRPTREAEQSAWPVGYDKHDQIRLNGLPRLDSIFDRLIDQPRVLPYLMEFVGEQKRASRAGGAVPPQLGNTWSISKSYNAEGLGWHRGIQPVDYSYSNGSIRTRMLNVVYFLTDNGPEDGCIVALPGSHKSSFDLKWGNYEGLELPGATAITGSAGDVFLFSEAVLHNGLHKTTQGVRTNLYYNYLHASRIGGLMIDPTSFHHFYWPPEIRERLTSRQREMTSWMDLFRWDH